MQEMNTSTSMTVDLDDYRQGKDGKANQVPVYSSPDHRVSMWTAEPGYDIPLRAHSRSECIMVIMGGMGEFRSGERAEMKTVDEGMMMVARPEVRYSLKNIGPDPLVVLMIEGPGPFDLKSH